MNIHEYQGKEILKKYGVAIQDGVVAETVAQAIEGAKKVQEMSGLEGVMVKAQIHAGGRGKGLVAATPQEETAIAELIEASKGKEWAEIREIAHGKEIGKVGGVMYAKDVNAVESKSSQLLNKPLFTLQTAGKGKVVNKVLIAQDMYYGDSNNIKEFYMSILLDRGTGKNVIIYSTEGGMDIETVAHNTPDKIFKEFVEPAIGFQGYQARRIAFNLGLSGAAFKEMVKFTTSLYNAYIGCDASMFEINPVLKTSDDKIIAVDAKVDLDENALYRHADLESMRDISEEDPLEVEAKKYNLNYVALDGNVGCMVNGAGLAMATMDMIKLSGGEPANFLDVGGTANAQTVEAGFRIILMNPEVKAILVNIFGGIVRCDRVANGIVEAYKNLGNVHVPIIVRLQGTNAEEAKKIINESGLKVYSAVALEEAASLVKQVLA